MIADRVNRRMKTRFAAIALIAAAVPFACARHAAGVGAERSCARQPQHRHAHPDHQSDRQAADRSQHRWAHQHRDERGSGDRSVRASRCARSAHQSELDDALCAVFAEPPSDLRRRLSRRRRRMHGQAGRFRRWRQRQAGEGQREGQAARTPLWPASRSASPTNSWPRSTARCPRRRPTHWRGVTALVRVESQNLPLIDATIGLFRITDGRSLDAVRRDFATAPGVRNLQFNFRYWCRTQSRRPKATRRNMRCQNSSCRRRTGWRTA